MSSARVLARNVTVNRPLALGAALVLGAALLFVFVHRITGGYWGDLAIYRYSAGLALHGRPLYDFVTSAGLSDNYPPFAALAMLPLAFLSMDAAIFGWAVLTLVALGAVIWLTLRHLGVGRRAELVLVIGIAVIPLYPVTGHLVVGQVDIFVVLLVLADLLGRAGSRWRGIGVGIAAGLKLTPMIFIAYLVLTRRFRAAGVAILTFLGTVGVGFLFAPSSSRPFWLGGVFLQSSRVTVDARTVNNQSLRGVLARLLDSGAPPMSLWLPLVLVVGVGGLAVAVWAHRRGEELLGVLACATTGLLVSPISWHHHWIWCVPALIAVAARGRRRAVPGVVLLWLMFVLSTLWLLITLGGHDLHFTGWALIYDNAYVLAGLVLLVVLGRHLRKGARRDLPDTGRR
jgi:alpha-1,2-mannosyltransferase